MDALDKDRKEKTDCPIWIDQTNRIISFTNAAGFDKILFASQKDKIAFAIEKCSAGYRIQ